MDAKATPDPTAADAPPLQDQVSLRALEPIRHDGVDYAPGDALEVTPAVAVQLMASDAAEPA